MKRWTQEKINEFASRWTDPEDDHPSDLLKEFGISRYYAQKLFGEAAIRKYPQNLTAKAWKELKDDWFNLQGPSAEKISTKYKISRSGILNFLPPIREARQGKRGSSLIELLGQAKFQELSDKINTGEFTTFFALVEQYPQVSVGKLRAAFGSPVDIKKQVVAENCPSTMSKSQYELAKSRWFDPDGGTRIQIALDSDTSGSTLERIFGRIKECRSRTRTSSLIAR